MLFRRLPLRAAARWYGTSEAPSTSPAAPKKKKMKNRILRRPRDQKPILRNPGTLSVQGIREEAEALPEVDLPPVETRIEALMEDDSIGSIDILEILTTDGDNLTDSQLSRLVTHCLAQKNEMHGSVSITMHDAACEEALAMVEAASRMGHTVGPETLCVLISMHANPTPGPARNIQTSLQLLSDHRDDIINSIPDPVVPFWVYEHILLGCAYDDDEDAALQLISDPTTPELTPEAWSYAISSCNAIPAMENMQTILHEKQADMNLQTIHYNAMLKVCSKSKMSGEDVICEMKEKDIEMDADTYVMWMACTAGLRKKDSGDKVRNIYHSLLTCIDDSEVTLGLISAVLQICLIHAQKPSDAYVALAREVYDGASRVGLNKSYYILTKTMHVFTKVGHTAYTEELYNECKQKGTGLSGHMWELNRDAHRTRGSRKSAAVMYEEALVKHNVPHEIHTYHGGYNAVPTSRVRPHGNARFTDSFIKPTELLSKPLPSTPKGY